MEFSREGSGCKDITSGKPFLFYFLNDQIQIIKHIDDKIPVMASNKNTLMKLFGGLSINVNEESTAIAHKSYWVHPQNTGNLTIDDGEIFFAGGNNYGLFKCLDVEVWGLH